MATKRAASGVRAFSKTKEASYGAGGATPNMRLNFDMASTLMDKRSNTVRLNEDEVTGYTQATEQEILNFKVDGSHQQRATPQNVALFASLVLGKIQNDTVLDTTSYKHWIQPLELSTDSTLMPSINMWECEGDVRTEANAFLYIGLFGKTFKISGARNDFIKMEANFGGEGSETVPGSLTFPAILTESYFRYGDADFKYAAYGAGATPAQLSGTVAAKTLAFGTGTSLKQHLKSFEYSVDNAVNPIYEIGDNTGFVTRAERGDRFKHSLSAKIEMQDDTFKTALVAGTLYTIQIPIIGGVIAGGTGIKNYTAELIFPKVVLKEANKGLDGRALINDLNFEVLQDPTYGSVVIAVTNTVASYMA